MKCSRRSNAPLHEDRFQLHRVLLWRIGHLGLHVSLPRAMCSVPYCCSYELGGPFRGYSSKNKRCFLWSIFGHLMFGNSHLLLWGTASENTGGGASLPKTDTSQMTSGKRFRTGPAAPAASQHYTPGLFNRPFFRFVWRSVNAASPASSCNLTKNQDA